jgi:hypothetical protein
MTWQNEISIRLSDGRNCECRQGGDQVITSDAQLRPPSQDTIQKHGPERLAACGFGRMAVEKGMGAQFVD